MKPKTLIALQRVCEACDEALVLLGEESNENLRSLIPIYAMGLFSRVKEELNGDREAALVALMIGAATTAGFFVATGGRK
jgi:hypothetical protein